MHFTYICEVIASQECVHFGLKSCQTQLDIEHNHKIVQYLIKDYSFFCSDCAISFSHLSYSCVVLRLQTSILATLKVI